MLGRLPVKVLHLVLIFLDVADALSCRLLACHFASICWDESLWRSRIKTRFPRSKPHPAASTASVPALIRIEVDLENRRHLADPPRDNVLLRIVSGGVKYAPCRMRVVKIACSLPRCAADGGAGTSDGIRLEDGDHVVLRLPGLTILHALTKHTERSNDGSTIDALHTAWWRPRGADERTDAGPACAIYKVSYDEDGGSNSLAWRLLAAGFIGPTLGAEWDDLDFAYYCSTSRLLKQSQRAPARAAFDGAMAKNVAGAASPHPIVTAPDSGVGTRGRGGPRGERPALWHHNALPRSQPFSPLFIVKYHLFESSLCEVARRASSMFTFAKSIPHRERDDMGFAVFCLPGHLVAQNECASTRRIFAHVASTGRPPSYYYYTFSYRLA
jgi:hypothetical protein